MAEPIGLILQQWADLGIFFYVLPFLLIFAITFAILQKIKITGGDDDRGINAIIALSIALLSLQFDTVPIFFQIIFPKLGIGLAILLTAIILMGLFIDFRASRGMAKLFLTIGGLIGVWILLSSFNEFSWWSGSWWQQHISTIVAGIIFLVLILVVINSGSKKNSELFTETKMLPFGSGGG